VAAAGDLVQVSRLEVGDAIAAASVGLRFGGRYYLVLSSYLAGELSQYGTGRFHLYEVMRDAIANRTRWFDFTVGDEAYKRDWADIEVKLHDYVAASGVKGIAIAGATAAYRRAKRTIKQNPRLWSAYTKARAVAGSWLLWLSGGGPGIG